jgi:hypothetical protein
VLIRIGIMQANALNSNQHTFFATMDKLHNENLILSGAN